MWQDNIDVITTYICFESHHINWNSKKTSFLSTVIKRKRQIRHHNTIIFALYQIITASHTNTYGCPMNHLEIYNITITPSDKKISFSLYSAHLL